MLSIILDTGRGGGQRRGGGRRCGQRHRRTPQDGGADLY